MTPQEEQEKFKEVLDALHSFETKTDEFNEILGFTDINEYFFNPEEDDEN